MPELAEVELARRIWAQAEGETIREIITNPKARIFRDLPSRALSSLKGKSITGSKHHGKRMYFSFGDDFHLEIHLGMSGKVYQTDLAHEQQKHDHLILKTNHRSLVLNDYRMFGRVMLHEGAPPWLSLSPDPLSPKFNLKRVQSIIKKRPKKILKGALLDQDLFPGLGNWMVDEICWRLGVHPAVRIRMLMLFLSLNNSAFPREVTLPKSLQRLGSFSTAGKKVENAPNVILL